MKIKGFIHVCLINDWQEIISEQFKLMIRSGLYDRCDEIYIGCVGEDVNQLKRFLARYSKPLVKIHVENIRCYEFPTLEYLHQKSIKDNNFLGFYIHTKGVSYPGHEGGKYWRDYMSYYNLTKWRDCVTKLNRGYDTVGVKLRPSPLHYSGNFFWFKSAYVKRLSSPLLMNMKDRFQAEFWIGSGKPNACSLCQLFVDYNTKGIFQPPKIMSKIYVHTLAYNLPSEVEKTTNLIYSQNDCEFKHYICDLGFPLLEGDKIPGSIPDAQKKNSDKLKEICVRYGSTYLRMENIGVSQNWTQIIKHCNLNDDDVIIGADPDERTMDDGWISAMAKVLRSGKIGMVSLIMPEQVEMMKQWKYVEQKVDDVRAINVFGTANWALIGFKGEYLRKMGDMPFPDTHPVYGYIETFVRRELEKHGYKNLFLPDHRVYHTDYPKDPGAPKLLRAWKNQIIFNFKQYGQMDFCKFLKMIKEGTIKLSNIRGFEIKDDVVIHADSL